MRIAYINDEITDHIKFRNQCVRWNGEEAIEMDVQHFQSALEFFESEEEFDLVITDLLMPKINGFDVWSYLKKMLINMPVVLFKSGIVEPTHKLSVIMHREACSIPEILRRYQILRGNQAKNIFQGNMAEVKYSAEVG